MRSRPSAARQRSCAIWGATRIEWRSAIADLLAFDGDQVSFQWKDYARENRSSTMTLSAMEFLRRFVQHILPRGFVRIRQSGFLANTCRVARVALARTLLATPVPAVASTDVPMTLTTDTLPRRLVGVSPMRRRDDHRAHPLGDPPRDRHMEFRYLMSPSRVGVSAFDHVIAHVSGEVCLDLPLEYRATALPDARTTTRLDAAVARAPPASPSTSFHARGS